MPTLTYTVPEVARELRMSRRITQQALEHFIATCEANEGNL